MAKVRIYQHQDDGIYSIRVNQENRDDTDKYSSWKLLGDFDIEPDEGIFMRPSLGLGAKLSKWVPPVPVVKIEISKEKEE